MKQHITIEQFNELSDKGKQSLRKYVLKELAEPIKDARTTGPFAGAIYHLEVPAEDYILSIGQMIEFLNTTHTVQIQQWMDEFKDWRVGLDWSSAEHFYYIVEKPELCDALWEAVKEILEK
jgi:hypothetical protein